MKDFDSLILENQYNLILSEDQINQELDEMLLDEGVLKDLIDAGSDYIAGGLNKGAEAMDKISQIPDVANKVNEYLHKALPDYVSSMGTFIKTAGIQFLSGSVGTYILGKLLMMLSKKISKDRAANYEILKNMLPQVVKDRVKALEGLKRSNPKEYTKQLFLVNQNALKELKKTLKQQGIKTEGNIIAKSLDYLGKFLSSTVGSLSGGIVIAFLISKLGYNPMPIFPSLQMGPTQ